MTRVINTVKGPRRVAERSSDPCKYESKEETAQRFRSIIRSLGMLINHIQTFWKKDQNTSRAIMEYSAKKHDVQENLNRLTGE